MSVSTKEKDATPALDVLQQHFAEALQSGDADALVKLVADDKKGAAFSKRFAVYRNNVYHSLSMALADAYPVVMRLVGEEFFLAMARAHLDAGGLPSKASLHDFGGEFAAFIEGFAPANGLPWLGDVARVERAWLRAYHGADMEGSASRDVSALTQANAETIARMRLLFHPSMQLEELEWHALEIWQAHQQEEVGKLQASQHKNILLAVRGLDGDVRMHSFDGNLLSFLQRLHQGESILSAAKDMQETAIAQVLSELVAIGAVVGVKMLLLRGEERLEK